MPVSRQKAEDPSEIGASPPLVGHTLDRTLHAYNEYHTLCSINRKNGTSFEINRERQRTEMLNRKYCDNLRQQQALSGRIDDPRPSQNGSAPPFEKKEETSFDSSNKLKISPAKVSKENARKNDETTPSDGNSSLHSHTSSSATGTSTAPSFTDARNGYGDVLIKTEPGTIGSTPPCLQSPPPSGNSSAGGLSKVPPSSLQFVPSSSASTNGRLGRSFSTPDAKRKCRSSRSSPLFGGGSEEMEEEDDLKLKPYVFLNNVIKTPPIKALEEGDDPPITPSPTNTGPVTRRSTSNPPTNSSCTSNHSNSNHSNPPLTPTAAGAISSSNGLSSNSSQMVEDLNEFYRVMEQVREKESRMSLGATSTQIDMYSNMSPPSLVGTGRGGGGGRGDVISPPPYNSAPSARLPQAGSSAARYGGTQQLHATPDLTSSPPFSTAEATHSLYNPPPPMGQQRPPSSTLALHQPQPQPYPTTARPVSMASSQVDMGLKFSDPSLRTLPSLPQHTTAFQTTAQQRQQYQAAGKHQKMHLSHLNQHGEVVSHQGMAQAQLGSSITPHMYYTSGQTQPQQAQRLHTSSTPLPPPAPPQQTPLTPTTPLGHYTAAFPTVQQNAQNPTSHRSNSLHHQTSLSGAHTHYTYTPETSHFLSNNVQSPYNQSMAVAQQRQMMQQHSAALTVSTNSWGAHRQTPRLAYKDNTMMSVHHASTVLGGGAQVPSSLPRMQHMGPVETTLTAYPPHLRVGQSLHHHTAAQQPPAYLQPCGSNSNPNAAVFSRLAFPHNMQ